MNKVKCIIIKGWVLLAFTLGQVSFSQEIWKDTSYSFDERAADLASRMTLAEKISQMNVYEVKAISRFGITPTHHLEALHGIWDWRIGNTSTTVFPMSIGLGSTWDTSAIRSIGAAISDEVRALNNSGIKTGMYCLSPVINMARDPRWGRTGETFGEDPYLTSQLGIAYVKGMQGDHPKYIKVITTPKHFAVNNEETIRLGGSATVDERSLREYYLPAFKSLFQVAGARSVMAAYNGINDVPCQANKMLLIDILKKEWGFGGYVITDGEGTGFLVNNHQYVSTFPEAVASSIKAGCDIDLSSGFYYLNYLQTAVNQGLITEQEVTTALTRFLKVRFELGEFDPPAAVPYTSISGSVNNCQAHRDLALSVARKSIVLLKNQGNFLPLHSGSITSIAVIGPFADTAVFGGYSGLQSNVATAFEGIKARAGSTVNVSYNKAYNIGGTNFNNAAVTLAENSDVAILCIGEEVSRFSGINGCGGETYDRPSLDLPKVAVDLAKAVYRVNPNMIVVLFNSEPWAINWINDSIPAIVEAWYGGQDQGKAIADVLFGDYNPSGKLPVTFHTSISQLPPMDDYDITKGRTYKYFTGKPLYPFGYGLSYTTFTYSNLQITPTTIGKDGEATITFDVKNTGSRAGDEVVQLYVHDIEASVKRPIKELKGFQRVLLQPGETKTATLKLKTEVLAFWDVNDDTFVVEPGYFEIMIGSSSEDIRLRDTIYATDQSVGIHPGGTVSHKNLFNCRLVTRKPGIVSIVYEMDTRMQLDKHPLTLDIYNSLGKQIFHATLSKRSNKFSWRGTSTNGLQAGQGVFFIKLTHKDRSGIIKCIIYR